MKSTKQDPLVFIVRIRFKPDETEKGPPRWIGTIEHLALGERRYFVDLKDLVEWLEGYIFD